MEFDNKNQLQKDFNQVKGIITELNDGAEYCSVTMKLGHEKLREVNFSTKKPHFDTIITKFKIGDRVCCKYYLASNKKDRWHTAAMLLSINHE